ncbi:MAG: hypothetical protein ACYDC6_06185 [Acidobacteriaceae bacterium]
MTRVELLRVLIRQAKLNGFEFRKWYASRMTLPWESFEAAVKTISEERRYYGLLFSHDFAQFFWRTGSKMAFVVPNTSFTRVSKDGSTKVVQRSGHTRRTVKADAWRYHLKQMAAADDPLRYIRRFLLIEEDLVAIQSVSDEEDSSAGTGTLDVGRIERFGSLNATRDSLGGNE